MKHMPSENDFEALLRATLTKAYQNGLTDTVAGYNGVIENNKHAQTIVEFMVIDVRASHQSTVTQAEAKAVEAFADKLKEHAMRGDEGWELMPEDIDAVLARLKEKSQ